VTTLRAKNVESYDRTWEWERGNSYSSESYFQVEATWSDLDLPPYVTF